MIDRYGCGVIVSLPRDRSLRINMPSKHELIAHGRTIPEIAKELGVDHLVYQEVEDLKAAILEGSDVEDLDMSCFDGRYITGTVTDEYLAWVESNQAS